MLGSPFAIRLGSARPIVDVAATQKRRTLFQVLMVMAVGAFLSIPCRMKKMGLSSRAKCIGLLQTISFSTCNMPKRDGGSTFRRASRRNHADNHENTRHLVSKGKYYMGSGSVSCIKFKQARTSFISLLLWKRHWRSTGNRSASFISDLRSRVVSLDSTTDVV